MASELAPELLETIFGHVLADSGDMETLAASSLAFPRYTTLFQRALCSKKPLTLSFNRNTDKDPRLRKMINTLVDLLGANPRFGALLGPDVRFHFCNSPEFLSDSRAAKIARCCSSTDSGIVSLTIKILDGGGSWNDLSEEARRALEGVIVNSPRLNTLKLVSMGIPWSTFLRQKPFLDYLVLHGGCYCVPRPPCSEPLPAAKPNDDGHKPTRIGRISGSPSELHRLAEALYDTVDADGKDAALAIDLSHLRALVAICKYDGGAMELRRFLHRTHRLEGLTVRTLSCTSLLDPLHVFYYEL